MRNHIGNAFAWWQEASTSQATDSRSQTIYRYFVRVGGIVLVFILSPVLVLAMVFLAFVTV